MMRIGVIGVALLALLVSVDAACQDNQVYHCNSCSNPGVECIVCPNGWLISVDKKECDQCPDHCEECEHDGAGGYSCVSCYDTYALRETDTVCLVCSAGCSECHHSEGDLTLCEECFDGWTLSSEETCLDCGSHCEECDEVDDGTVCTQCDEGYFLKADKTCRACPSDCEVCRNNGEDVGVCTQCEDNYEINNEDATSACLSCPSTCSSCIGEARTGTIAKCDSCHDAWALENDECVSCDENCVDCETPDICSECREEFRVDANDQCESCADNCVECSLSDTDVEECDECDEGYVPKTEDEVTCDSCGSHCIQCSLGGSCSNCDEEWVAVNGDCQHCPSNCLECTSQSTCRTNGCKDDYATDPVNGDCEQCPDHCQSGQCAWGASAGEPICNSCDNEFIRNDDKTSCESCPSNCASCTWNATDSGRSVCTACHDYYELRLEGCERCPANCMACTYNATSEAFDCDSESACDSGYRLGEDMGNDGNGDNDICVLCGVDDCHRCNETDACVTCNTPFQKSTSGSECRDCPSHCTACHWNGDESDTLCDTNGCEETYGITDVNTCQKCSSHCLQCPVNGDGDFPCTSCESGYIDNDEGKCKSCPSQCQACSWSDSLSATDCNSGRCNSRYARSGVVDSQEGKCLACPDNCAECEVEADDQGEAVTVCTECDNEFALRSDDGLCVACPEFCNRCTHNSDTDATECDSNDDCFSCYGITDDFQCEECPKNCEDCIVEEETGVMKCDECKDYYVSNDRICGSCPDHCKVCSHSSGSIDCTTCDDEYALFEGECIACPSHCEECSANSAGVTECKENQCNEGYGRDGTKKCKTCGAMFEKCDRCSDQTGVDVNGQDVADCHRCTSQYTLADDSSMCKDIWSGTCNMYEDRKYVCSDGSCDEGYTMMANGSCSSMCYKCGDPRNNQLMDYETCETTWREALNQENATMGQEICLHDCWVIAEKAIGESEYRIARGCGISDEDMDTLGITPDTENKCKGGQVCKWTLRDGTFVRRCWKCCQGDLCNDSQAGSAAIQACLALLGAAMLALHM